MGEPIVAGLDPVTFKPYICNMDLIGCITEPVDFVAGGTCEEQLMGMCETLWEPKMKPDQLFECISQAVMNAMDRDAISGWGAVVHIIEKDKVTTRTLKTRRLKFCNSNNINHQVLSSDILCVPILDSICHQHLLPGKF